MWAMKKKANGTHCARLNARGYEQIDGEHYDENAKAAPVVNDATIKIVFILMIMARWYSEIVDVCGAFLYGEFENETEVYMEVPKGFEKYFPADVILLLMKTIHGLKQAANAFWKKLLKAYLEMAYKWSKADPCLYFKWTAVGLVIWMSWVDDCIVCGNKQNVLPEKEKFMKQFECDEVGELKEYICCKIDYEPEKGQLKLMQPVLIQSFVDEFDLPNGDFPNTPGIPGDVLQHGKPEDAVGAADQSMYHSGTGKLIH